MSKNLYLIYKDSVIASFDLVQYNMIINESFFLENRKYNILAVVGEKGACSLIIKHQNKILFSTIFDANRIGFPSTSLFFLIANEEYLQIEFLIEA